MRRVVVTGFGAVTPLGVGVDFIWKRLLNGESGISPIDQFDVSDLSVKIAGSIPVGETSDGMFNANDWVAPKDQRKMDRFILYAIAAAKQAVQDSGWVAESEDDQERTGVLIGSGIGGLTGIAEGALTLENRGPRRISPFFIPACLINLASGHVRRRAHYHV